MKMKLSLNLVKPDAINVFVTNGTSRCIHYLVAKLKPFFSFAL
jgi:hypothetical protein